MPSFNIISLLLFSAFGAEVLGTMAGFGSATVLTPIASWFLPIKTAVALVACFHLFGNVSRVFFFRQHINWTIVKQFGMPGILLSFVGAQAASWLSPQYIRMCLGGFLLVYVFMELRQATSARLPATTTTLVLGGMASGVIAGLIGTGGAIRSVCLLAFGLPKETYIGTSAVIALMVDATRLPVYLMQGFLPTNLVPVLASLTVVAFCGVWIGQRLVRRVSPVYFKRFVLLMLFAIGIKLVVDGTRGLG